MRRPALVLSVLVAAGIVAVIAWRVLARGDDIVGAWSGTMNMRISAVYYTDWTYDGPIALDIVQRDDDTVEGTFKCLGAFCGAALAEPIPVKGSFDDDTLVVGFSVPAIEGDEANWKFEMDYAGHALVGTVERTTSTGFGFRTTSGRVRLQRQQQ